jgi:hypothetical protein
MKKIRLYQIVGLTFLCLQVISIIYARFVPEKFFCWAPYDQHSYYEINVELDGQTLSTEETRLRYRYRTIGWEPRSINNVISIVRQYEKTYGKNDEAKVVLTYESNGHPEQSWRWPE